MKVTNKVKCVLLCVIVCSVILWLRLMTNYPNEIILLSKGLLADFDGLINAFGFGKISAVISGLPLAVIMLGLELPAILVGLIMIRFFPGKAVQGAATLFYDISDVVKLGICAFLTLGGLIAVFMYSVVGAPIALAIFTVSRITGFIGRVPLAIFVGYAVSDFLKVERRGLYSSFILGSVLMSISCCVYAIGGAFSFFVYPVLAWGIVCQMVRNKGLFRHYSVFDEGRGKNRFDKSRISDIITDGLEQ